MHDDVVISGAGPTGLTLACQLLSRRVACRVVDASPGPTPMSRAIGLSTRSLEILDEIGAAEDILARGRRMLRVNFHSFGRTIGQIQTSVGSGTRFPFMTVLPQSEIEAVLESHVERLGGRIEHDLTLTEMRAESGADRVGLALEGPGREREEGSASWLVGADGSHSVVRNQSGIAFAGKASDVVFVIADAALERDLPESEGHYFFSPAGLLVVIPLPDGMYRLAATRPAGAPCEGHIDIPVFQRLVDARGAGEQIHIRELRDAGWGAAQVHIQSRVAERFRAERCMLAGDAAHVYSPVGGQGMNTGIQDAHNLAWKLSLVAGGHAPPSLLDTYEIERRARALQMLRENRSQTKLATMGTWLGRVVQRAVIGRASKGGLVNRKMVMGLAQLDVTYRDGGLIAGGRRRKPVGRRIPDAPLSGAPDGPATVHRLLRDHAFVLLVLGDPVAAHELRGSVRSRYGDLVGVYAIAPRGVAAAGHHAVLVDEDGELHDHLRAQGPTLCLTRADAHVAAVGDTSEPDAVLSLLDRAIQRAPASLISS